MDLKQKTSFGSREAEDIDIPGVGTLKSLAPGKVRLVYSPEFEEKLYATSLKLMRDKLPENSPGKKRLLQEITKMEKKSSLLDTFGQGYLEGAKLQASIDPQLLKYVDFLERNPKFSAGVGVAGTLGGLAVNPITGAIYGATQGGLGGAAGGGLGNMVGSGIGGTLGNLIGSRFGVGGEMLGGTLGGIGGGIAGTYGGTKLGKKLLSGKDKKDKVDKKEPKETSSDIQKTSSVSREARAVLVKRAFDMGDLGSRVLKGAAGGFIGSIPGTLLGSPLLQLGGAGLGGVIGSRLGSGKKKDKKKEAPEKKDA